jgi:hypothetical protein
MSMGRTLLAAVLAAVLALASALDFSAAQTLAPQAALSDDCAGMAAPCDPATMGEDCDTVPCCTTASTGFAFIAADIPILIFDSPGRAATPSSPALVASTRAPPLRPPLA